MISHSMRRENDIWKEKPKVVASEVKISTEWSPSMHLLEEWQQVLLSIADGETNKVIFIFFESNFPYAEV